jgi:putative drug exporter of the RND superfamily
VQIPLLIRIFRIAAITEAITWLGLLAGMYEKYIAGTHTAGIQIFGTLHGYAFLAYVLVVFLVRAEYKWTNRMTLLALLASVPPLATLPFERWAFRLYRER